MTIEIEHAPVCCQRSIKRIQDILNAGNCLTEVLAVAPALSRPGPARLSILGLLWRLGSGGVSWARERRRTRRLVNAIIQNRVYTVIDLEIITHAGSGQTELEQQRTRIREVF